MYKDFKVVKTQIYPLGVYFRHAGLHIAAVHRRIHKEDTAEFGIILYDRKHRGGVRIPFPEENRVGSVYAMLLEGYQNREFSYLFYCGDRVWQDPYCRKIECTTKYGVPRKGPVRCMVPAEHYDWEEDRAPGIPYENAVLYALHVRGFTKHRSSGVAHRGTYAGITEKIFYLKDLGITSVLLMPAYEFDEIQMQENGQTFLKTERAAASYRHVAEGNAEEQETASGPAGQELPYKINYWGYRRGMYYSPKGAYAHSQDAVSEFKDMVKALHREGIEVLMQFYFPTEVAPAEMLDVLKYWKVEYHIDGFHVMGVDLPVGMFAAEPLLSDTKLLTVQQYSPAAAEPAALSRSIGWLSEGFQYDMRRLLKGDDNMIGQFIFHVRNNRPETGIVNYIAKWDGFRLADLVSYDRKHNEDNGEDNRDGTDYNCSWNCGVEGRSRRKSILQLRMKQMQNAMTLVFLAQGTPLLYSGDEFGNTQNGNNNPYCQDNDTGWIKWNQMESGKALFTYTKKLIRLRREHPILHSAMPLKGMDTLSCGYPDVSFHGKEAWRPDTSPASRSMGVMYCGYYGEIDGRRDEDFIYFGVNLYWESHVLGLPTLPKGKAWRLCASTDTQEITDGKAQTELQETGKQAEQAEARPEEQTKEQLKEQPKGNPDGQAEDHLQKVTISPRTIVIYTTRDCPVPEPQQKQRRRRGKSSSGKKEGDGGNNG